MKMIICGVLGTPELVIILLLLGLLGIPILFYQLGKKSGYGKGYKEAVKDLKKNV